MLDLTDHDHDQIAWAESNAIVFANSVLGARTNSYGDFIDISCAITGRAPATGLHLDSGRRGTVVFRLTDLPRSLVSEDVFFPVLGHLIGLSCGSGVPIVTPIINRIDGVVMTDSAKWAWYAPGNIGVEVAFGSMAECIRSAQAGRIMRDPGLWHGI